MNVCFKSDHSAANFIVILLEYALRLATVCFTKSTLHSTQ